MEYFDKIFNNCAEVSQLSLEHEKFNTLSIKKKLELKVHILFCNCCSNFIKQSKKIDSSMKFFIDNIDKNPPFKAPLELKEKLREKLK
jgi:hypothetical protein